MADIYMDTGMRGDITLLKGEGHVWMEMSSKIWSGTAWVTDNYDQYMGCIMENWMLTQTRDSEDLTLSCVNGKFTIDTDKNYKVSVATKNLPFMLRASLMGLNTYKDAVSGIKVIKQVKHEFSVDTPDLTYDMVAGITELVAATDIHKVVSLYDKSTGYFWYEATTALDASYRFSVAAGVITFETTPDTDFVMVIQYKIGMEAGDFMAYDDGETFPNEVNMTLSWLARVESGADKGKKGYLIAKVNHAKPISDVTIGGDAKASESGTFEFNVNFQESGDVELHFEALA